MNKILVLFGFLVGMSELSGMNISPGKPEFECDNEEWSVTCRNMSSEDLKKYAAELDCAIHVTFESCDLSEGIFCTNAVSLTFRNCHPIADEDDVFHYVGLGDFPSDVNITIEGYGK